MTTQHSESSLFYLVVRQQPCKARLCSFKEKVDRRPIDPPPIIQLKSHQTDDEYLQNPYFFLYATLTDVRGETDLHFVNGNRTTAGAVVQSLHKLKDHDNTDGGFFIFSDISVRLEGFYRLKFTLYEINGVDVDRVCSITSDIFKVYSPKSFPGMSESTFLTRSFSDQGVRIRIRKEPRTSFVSNVLGERKRKADNDSEEEMIMEDSPPIIEPKIDYPPEQSPTTKSYTYQKNTLPPIRSAIMSIQKLLSRDEDATSSPSNQYYNQDNSLFSTRILPLPRKNSNSSIINHSSSPSTTASSWHHQQQQQQQARPSSSSKSNTTSPYTHQR